MSKKKSQPTSSPPGKAKSVGKAKSNNSKGTSSSAASTKWITENRKAKHRFEILESIECGLILVGSEVKSLRDGKCSLDESYGRVKGASCGWWGAIFQSTSKHRFGIMNRNARESCCSIGAK